MLAIFCQRCGTEQPSSFPGSLTATTTACAKCKSPAHWFMRADPEIMERERRATEAALTPPDDALPPGYVLKCGRCGRPAPTPAPTSCEICGARFVRLEVKELERRERAAARGAEALSAVSAAQVISGRNARLAYLAAVGAGEAVGDFENFVKRGGVLRV